MTPNSNINHSAHPSQRITTGLWFDREAEDAAKQYVAIFENSAINGVTYYGAAGFEVHGMPEGTVMTVDFELDGRKFQAINGGPRFKFNEAVSFIVHCETQAQIDYYWERLGEGGDPAAQRCGWLKDRYGVSWQVVPADFARMAREPEKMQRAMSALMEMRKIDLEVLRRAWAGE